MKRFLILAALVAGISVTGLSSSVMAHGGHRGHRGHRHGGHGWHGGRGWYGDYRGGWRGYGYGGPRIIIGSPFGYGAYGYGGYGGYGYGGYGYGCGW